MKSQVIKPFVASGIIALTMTLLTGCASCKPGKPGPVRSYTIEVALDPSLGNSPVVVDLVGVNSSNLPRWEAYDMGKYWKEDVMRRDADKVPLSFASGQGLSKSLAVTDPQWERWKKQGVTHLMVLADLPVSQASKPGNQDPRRQILALDECSWPKKTKTLSVLVQSSGIKVLTPPRPPG